MVQSVPFGAVELHLVSGVALLREDVSVFEAMLAGWSAQQLGGRNLQAYTVSQRVHAVRRFQGHVATYPWEWSAAGFDEWMTDLVTVRQLSSASIRNYQVAIRQ